MSDDLTGKVPGIHDGEVHIERPNGSRLVVIVDIAPLKDDGGEVIGAINCFYDITERKKAEETTGNRKQTDGLLRILSLRSEIVIVTGDDVEQAKPSPDAFVTVANRLKMHIELHRGRRQRAGHARPDGEERSRSAFSRAVTARRNWSNRARSGFTPIRPIC
jgi:PAS domain